MTDTEKRQVLEMLDAGKINADQALTLMHALGEEVENEDEVNDSQGEGYPSESSNVVDFSTEPDLAVDMGSDSSMDPDLERQMKKARSLWGYATLIGVLLTVAGAFGLYSAVVNNGVGFWFFLASLPFFIGVLVLALAISNRGKRWLYVDVQPNKKGSPNRIVISLPLSLLTWGVALFGNIKSDIGKDVLQPILDALEKPEHQADPVLVHVNGKNGEIVTVFIA